MTSLLSYKSSITGAKPISPYFANSIRTLSICQSHRILTIFFIGCKYKKHHVKLLKLLLGSVYTHIPSVCGLGEKRLS